MSEYQYYEFQAIDRHLTQEERAAIGELSSRVKPTATSASFTYSYGSAGSVFRYHVLHRQLGNTAINVSFSHIPDQPRGN